MKKWIALVLLGGFMPPLISSAIDLKQSKFTQVVNNVEIISAADKARHAATVNDIFSMPDVLRTGPDSRAELAATDGTITRVGANTIFSFDPASRTIKLDQGSLLFHSPHGKGGGTIRTGSATASVIGTTIIVTCTPSGAFKLLDLEGQAEIRYLDGLKQTLEPGQMTFILPGGSASPIVVFRLDTETKGSALVGGFNTPLDSQSKINSEVTQQLLQILNGTAADTGYIVGENATPNTVVANIDNTPSATLPDGSIVGSDRVSKLPVNYPPLDPNHVQTTSFTPPTGVASIAEGLTVFGLGAPDSGFFGNNIDVDTANIDLSSFTGNSAFDIMAAGDMRIWQSLDFNAGVLPGTVGLFSGGDLSIAPDSTLEADTGKFVLAADSFSTLDTADGSIAAPNTLEYINIYNDVGDVDVFSVQSLGIYDSEIYAAGKVQIVSDANLALGTLDDIYIDAGGNVTLFAGILTGGNLDVEYTEIDAGDSAGGGSMNLNAGGNVYIYDADLYAYDGDTGLGNINIDAGGTVDIEDTYIEADGDVNIESGGTLTLEDYSEIDAYGASGLSLKSDNSDVDINDSYLYAYNAGVNINAAGSVDIENYSDIYAYDDVNINSASAFATVSLKRFAPASLAGGTGSVDIENSYIYAGWDGEGSSFDGGSVNINAFNGDVYLYDDEIYANSGELSDGDVNIYASGSVDLDYVYDLSADGAINIESGDTLTVEDSSDLEAYNGDVSLISDNADVDIYNSYIYSDYGNVNINADNGGVYVSDGDIEAGYDSDVSTGDVNIRAYNGTADIENTYISAQGNVSIESSGTLTLNYYQYDDYYADNYEIYANNGSVSLKSDNADVDITGYDIYAYGADADGNAVTVSAAGNVSVNNSYFGVYNRGNIKVNAGGNIDVLYTDGSGSGSVNLTAGGYVNVYDDTMDIGSFHVTAGTYADFGADQYADIFDSSITANGGGVNITGNSAGVDIDNTQITSTGDINVTAGGGDYLDSLASGKHVALSHVGGHSALLKSSVKLTLVRPAGLEDGSVITASDGDVVITPIIGPLTTGDVNISAMNDIDISDTDIEAVAGHVTIFADYGNVDIENSTINASGLVDIEAGYDDLLVGSETLTLNDDTITAGASITANAPGDISVSGGSITANGGDVDIQSTGGAVDIEDTYIYANGNVNIESFGTLTLGNTSGNTINANGWASLSSTIGDADIYNYSIYTYGSDVDGNGLTISTVAGNVNLGNDYIDAYYGGVVTITALGVNSMVDLDNAHVYANGNVVIEASSTLTFEDNSDIESDGYNGISLTSVNAGVDVLDSSLYAYDGDVDITALGSSGIIDIENTYISAYGNVNIESSGTLTLGDGNYNTIHAGGTVNLTSVSGDVDIYGDYTINSYGSDEGGNGITISAGSGIDIENDHDIYADYGGVKISAVGPIYLGSDDIEAGYDSYYYNNDMNIISAVGTVDVAGTYLYAAGDVNIESSGTLTIEDYYDSSSESSYSSEIDSDGSSGISLTSDNADVDVYDSSLYSYYGDVDITAVSGSANIDIENDNISAHGNVNVESDGTLTLGNVETGGDTIYAGSGIYLTSDSSDVDVYNSSIYGGFDGTLVDATVEDGSTLMAGGVANLDAYGAEIYIHAPNGSVYIENTTINPGGGINISDATVIADGSDINGNGVNIYSDGYFYVGGYSDTLYDDGIVGNNISISGSTITADNGGVSIVNDASFSTRDAVSFNLESTTMKYGDITISGGSTITANNGSIYIETASSDLSDVYVDEGSSLSVGDISISGSTIKATGAGGNVTISAGGSLTDASGLEMLTLVGDTIVAGGTVTLTAQGDIDVDQNVSDTTALTAGGGDVDVTSHNGNMDMENSTVLAGGSVALNAAGSVNLKSGSVTGTKNVNVNAGTGITINGVAVTASDPVYGVYLTSTAGQTTIQNGSSVTGNLTVNSPDGILIDGSHGGRFSGGTMNLMASSGDINVNNEDLTAFPIINLSARTINLADVDFSGSSHVTLNSLLGLLAPLPNTGLLSVPGDVNFIRGVTFGGTLITAANELTYINPASGSGIQIGTLLP